MSKFRRRESLKDEEEEEGDVFDDIQSDEASNTDSNEEYSDINDEFENNKKTDEQHLVILGNNYGVRNNVENLKATNNSDSAHEYGDNCYYRGLKIKNRRSFDDRSCPLNDDAKTIAQRMREDPCFVPRSEKYFLHDNRLEEDGRLIEDHKHGSSGDENTGNNSFIVHSHKKSVNANNSIASEIPRAVQTRIGRSRSLWYENSNRKWTHDKYFELLEENIEENMIRRRRGNLHYYNVGRRDLYFRKRIPFRYPYGTLHKFDSRNHRTEFESVPNNISSRCNDNYSGSNNRKRSFNFTYVTRNDCIVAQKIRDGRTGDVSNFNEMADEIDIINRKSLSNHYIRIHKRKNGGKRQMDRESGTSMWRMTTDNFNDSYSRMVRNIEQRQKLISNNKKDIEYQSVPMFFRRKANNEKKECSDTNGN